MRFATGDQRLLYYDEGRSTLVTVGRNGASGNVWLHTDVSIRNWDELLASAHVLWEALSDDPLEWLDLAETYERLEDPRRAALVRARALGWLPPGDPLREEVLSGLLPEP